MRFTARALLVGATTAAAGAALLAAAAPAGAGGYGGPPYGGPSSTLYVAPSGAPTASGWGSSCQHPNDTSIQPAIEAAPVGGTVVVCAGTYPGMINVDRQITLSGQPGAVIDATGDVYGIGVSAPYSTVQGLTVQNANNPELGDGIVTGTLAADGTATPADHVRIVHDMVTGSAAAGIDLNSSSFSTASFDTSNDNGIGINVSDDLGRAADHNTITLNTTDENSGGCGIALADHSGQGVNDNLVAFNASDNNGLATPTAPDASAGSGVILASPTPGGTVSGNTITLNEFHGNGHGGVVVHAHIPGQNFSGNTVSFNRIGTNNNRTDENDPATTGVYLGSASPLSINVSGNVIGPDVYGIFASGPVTVTGFPNLYLGVTHKLGTAPSF